MYRIDVIIGGETYATEGIWDGVLEYKRANPNLYYTKEVKSKVLFVRADFEKMAAYLADDCVSIPIIFNQLCDGTWIEIWRGKILNSETVTNHSKQFISTKPKRDDVYFCLEEAWEVSQSIYGAMVQPVLAQIGTYEEVCLVDDTWPYEPPPNPTVPFPEVGCWPPISYEFVQYQTSPDMWATTTCFARWVEYSDCIDGVATPPSLPTSGWHLLEDNCPSPSTFWSCPPSSYENEYSTGRNLSDVIVLMVENLNCDEITSISSRFFGFGTHPDSSPEPVNSAYDYAEKYLKHLTVHQKSDVKRPTSTNKATSDAWHMSLKDLLGDLATLFEVYYIVEDGVMHIEHISWFNEPSSEFDATTAAQTLQLDAAVDTASKQTFQYLDETCSASFRDIGIVYFCGSGTEDKKLRLFSNDIGYISTLANEGQISDSGFVLIANKVVDGDLHVVTGNLALAWGELQREVLRYNRLATQLKINNLPNTAASLKKTRVQQPFFVKANICQVPEPNTPVTTLLGSGQIDTMEVNLKKEVIKLTINH